MKFIEKLQSIMKNKIIIAIVAILIPIFIELIVFHKIAFEIATLIRIGFVYGIYFLIFTFYILSKKSEKIKILLEMIIKYRYLIAVILFIVLVACNINLSSIDVWCNFLKESSEYKSTIIGVPREIRSDEWLVQTPIFLAQTKNEEGPQIYNDHIAQGGSSALLTSAPAWDITNLCKPMNWGFLLFGTDYGFSWYWAFKILAITMVSFEIARKISKKDTLLSIVGGIALAIAPPMMWWFSTAIVESYIYGFAVVVLFSYYMENLNWNLWKKILIGLRNDNICSRICFCFVSSFPSTICIYNGHIYDL